VHATLDGADPQVVPGGNLIFDTAGALSAATAVQTLPTWNLSSGAVTPWSPGLIDFTGTTQYGSDSSVDRLTQGGYAPAAWSGIGVGSDGIVQGRYSNGQTRNMGQVVLATFADPNGLLNLGNNQWSATSASGRNWSARRLREAAASSSRQRSRIRTSI
jgi:flagellar hook protein FlgE